MTGNLSDELESIDRTLKVNTSPLVIERLEARREQVIEERKKLEDRRLKIKHSYKSAKVKVFLYGNEEYPVYHLIIPKDEWQLEGSKEVSLEFYNRFKKLEEEWDELQKELGRMANGGE